MDAETTFGDMTVYALPLKLVILVVTRKRNFSCLLVITQNLESIYIIGIRGTDLSGCPRVQIPYPLRLQLPKHLPERTENITTKL
jgi:hypothetical protein